MSSAGAVPAERERASGGLTPAQWYCLIAGAALLVLGVAGFFVNATFDEIEGVAQGDKILAFEVNGWHNVIHIASGVVLLAAAARARAAKIGALAFGAVYLVVAVWGFFSGEDILFVAINTVDNWLHVGLAVFGLIAGIVSPALRRSTA